MTERITLAAAADLIHDSTTLALGGMTLYRRPVALVRELLRRNTRPKDLTLLAFTAGYAADLLVGAGCVSAVRCVYFGLEVFGLAPMFTAKAHQGNIRIIEETETSLIYGLQATIRGLDFMPSQAWQGTDLFRVRPDVKCIEDPYSGKLLTAFPAINIDAALIHALEADSLGNIAINNNMGIDQTLVYAADTVIATCERFVDRIQPDPRKTVIPARGIQFIAHAPDGASPTSCYPLYPMDGHEFMRYVDGVSSESSFEAYLETVLQTKPMPQGF